RTSTIRPPWRRVAWVPNGAGGVRSMETCFLWHSSTRRTQIIASDTQPQPIIHSFRQCFGLQPPHRKRANIVLLSQRGGQVVDTHFMPDHLITCRGRRLGDAFNLHTDALRRRLKRLLFHFLAFEERAACPTAMPVKPRPVIPRALHGVVIPPPAPLHDPLREHVHPLALFWLIGEEILGQAHEDHLALLG